MLRAAVLSLVILLSLGVTLSFVTNWTEASRPRAVKKYKKAAKYSKVWWRQYRAKQRRQRALAMRRSALAQQRRAALAKERLENADQKPAQTVSVSEVVPSLGSKVPENWKGQVAAQNNGEVQFSVSDTNGQQIGSAQIAVVGMAMPSDESATERTRSKTLGGVPVSALRRTVIDKMVREQGWVVNDYQYEVSGKRVFVVVAQTPSNGATQSRLFYFTEVDGRIYSLATNSANGYSDKVAADSEQVLSAILGNNRPAEQASSERR